MNIRIEEHEQFTLLILEPTTDEEHNALEHFGYYHSPLKAKIKGNPSPTFPILEVQGGK